MSEPQPLQSAAVPQEQFDTLVQELMTPPPAASTPAQALAVSPVGGAALPAAVAPAPLFYTHQAMIELMLEHPEYSHEQLARHFGRKQSWLTSVLASDSFQQALDPHRHLISDPSITATMQERFRALAIRTSNVLLDKLDKSDVSDLVVLKASELSIKALGMGQPKMEAPAPAAQPTPTHHALADALLDMMAKRKMEAGTVDAETVEVKQPHGDV